LGKEGKLKRKLRQAEDKSCRRKESQAKEETYLSSGEKKRQAGKERGAS
jgi:hypothetical protein